MEDRISGWLYHYHENFLQERWPLWKMAYIIEIFWTGGLVYNTSSSFKL